jgi:sec-independent protein translocase protein TatA
MTTPLVAVPGGWELIVIVLVIVLLFGAKKLPELARGSGQALRIFKDETKGLTGDDDTATPEQREIEARQAEAQAETERAREQRPDDTTA